MDDKGDVQTTKDTSVTTEVNSGYTFLVQSRASLGEDVPPKHGNVPLFKNKRRRTSPQDHAILEAAYQKNSKPDKAERVDIVNRVQLGEKEVQIWFQNRRQNDRRRSKPLEPYELLAHFRKMVPNPVIPHESNLPSAHIESLNSTNNLSSQSPKNLDDASLPLVTLCSSQVKDTQPSQSSFGSASSEKSVQEQYTPPSTLEQQPPDVQQSFQCVDNKSDDFSSPCIGSQGSAKKRQYDEVIEENSSLGTADTIEVEKLSKPKHSLRRSSSMHLSMTMDGSVKIRTNNEPTPSPPKARAAAPDFKCSTQIFGDKRNVDSIEVFKDLQPDRKAKQLGAGFGRSRDTRTWEFYCDNVSNEALSTQAEAETNGSAVGAINLIRSNNPKLRSQLLSPNLSRANTQSVTRNDKAGKPRLGRSKSSLARLQNLGKGTSTSDVEKRPHHLRSPSGDSDKENWAPGSRVSEHALRRTHPSSNTRPILRENESVIFQDLGSARDRDKGTPRKEAAKEDDLDCIQGLLSLSQGAWK